MASTATALLSNRATLGRAAVVSVRTKSRSNVFKLYCEGLKSWRLKGSNPVPNEVAIHKTGCFWDFSLAYSVFSLNLGWSTFFSFPGQQNEKRKSRTHEETRTASPTSSWTPASWPESKKLFSARNNDVCNKQKGNASEREAHKAKNVNVSQPESSCGRRLRPNVHKHQSRKFSFVRSEGGVSQQIWGIFHGKTKRLLEHSWVCARRVAVILASCKELVMQRKRKVITFTACFSNRHSQYQCESTDS